MADSGQADTPDATGARGMEGEDVQNKLLHALRAGTEGEEPAMLRNEQSHQARRGRAMLVGVDGGCGRVVASRRLSFGAFFQALDIACTLLVVVWAKEREQSLPVHSKRLFLFALVAPCYVHIIEPLCNLCMNVLAYGLTDDTRLFNNDDGLFCLLHFKLFNRLALLIWVTKEFNLLVAKVLWEHLLTSVSLNVQEHYSKCLGNLGCLPRTLADLYGSKTCPVLAWWRNSLGHSRQDVHRAGACLYTSEYGEHSQNYFNCDVLGACVVAYVLYKTMLTIDTAFKNTVKDTTAQYKLYTEERRQGATSWIEAYYAASLECFRKTRNKPVTPPARWTFVVICHVVDLLTLLAMTMLSAAEILQQAF